MDDRGARAGGAPVEDEPAVQQFLEACRQVQTRAAALCASGALPARTREMLKDLRLRLLAARKVLLSPAATEIADAAGAVPEAPLLRRPPPVANPLAPHPPKSPPR